MQRPDPEPGPQEGISRRGMLQGAAGVGAATVAAGFLVSALAEPASAAVADPAKAASAPQQANSTAGDAIVAHVRDPRTGDIDLFVGTRHIRVRDTDLAVRLSRAAD